MKRFITLMLTGATLALAGCEYDGVAGAAKLDKEKARAGASPVAYQEVPYEGRIYVVSSDKAAENVKKGVLPATVVTKIGAGPNRETVVIEADKNYVEEALATEWAKRHPKK